MRKIKILTWMVALFCFSGFANNVFGPARSRINIPDLTQVTFAGLGGVSGVTLMYLGIVDVRLRGGLRPVPI